MPKQVTAEELSQMNRDFVKALNAKDAMILPLNEAPVKGRARVQKYREAGIAAGTSDAEVVITAIGSNGDPGYETGRLQMKIKMPDGRIEAERGKYTELLKRGEDGRWKSTHGMWNNDAFDLK